MKKTIRPILEHYEEAELLNKVPGDLALKEVTAAISSIVEQK